jgi:hypothetical protein
MAVQLFATQQAAVDKLSNGKVLKGGVGTGKSITALAYFYTKVAGGVIRDDGSLAPPAKSMPLYIITTANKRDKREWIHEYTRFLLEGVTVDSWNNIKKYADVKDAFFIFDEQRIGGSGVWSRQFIRIAHANMWILLTATPGDTWMDYCSLFIANGLYKNKTEFCREHVIWKPYRNYPCIERYVNTRMLERHKQNLLVELEPMRVIRKSWQDITTSYDKTAMDQVINGRWDIRAMKPLRDAAAVCRCARYLVNSDDSRFEALDRLLDKHPRIILFYNFDYELSALLHRYDLEEEVEVAQWNGHMHEPVPTGSHWLYLVQYSAGAEGWECTNTDTVVFWSLSYSWKAMEQAAGRINRLNTAFDHLYYYRFLSDSVIDKSIMRALNRKEAFNEKRFVDDIPSK